MKTETLLTDVQGASLHVQTVNTLNNLRLKKTILKNSVRTIKEEFFKTFVMYPALTVYYKHNYNALCSMHNTL